MNRLSQNQIQAYQTDGAVLVKGLLADWVDVIRAGIQPNMIV